MFTNPHPYREPLHDSLVLKSISTEDEIARLSAFNLHIHQEPGIDTMTHHLIVDHPLTHPNHWLFVEDESTNEIVSSLALIPWHWEYDGVTLRTGEMGIVGTHEAYRRQGLVRALDRRFKALLADEGFVLSHIQGIPYYYRQFGYEYALPLEGGWHLELHQVPDRLDDQSRQYTFRLATEADIDPLSRFYDIAISQHMVRALRSPAVWNYLLTITPDTAEHTEHWLVLDGAGTVTGYFAVQLAGFGTGLNLREASQLPYPAARAALYHARQLARERGKSDIRVFPAPDNSLIKAARAWGAHGGRQYAWQILIPDAARMFQTIAPALERRLAHSVFAGMPFTLRLNLYRSVVDLSFADGTLRVETPAHTAAADVSGVANLPPNLLPPLVLGYRSREELADIYLDFMVEGDAVPLLDVLFPQRTSYIYVQY